MLGTLEQVEMADKIVLLAEAQNPRHQA